MVLIRVIFVLFQRDELKCPALPNACSCTSAASGEPGPQGPVVGTSPRPVKSDMEPVSLIMWNHMSVKFKSVSERLCLLGGSFCSSNSLFPSRCF